jgi:hypothetical protein
MGLLVRLAESGRVVTGNVGDVLRFNGQDWDLGSGMSLLTWGAITMGSSAGGDRFPYKGFGGAPEQTTEGQARLYLRRSCLISNFAWSLDVALASNGTAVLRQNNVDTSLSVLMVAGQLTASFAGSQVWPAGSYISVVTRTVASEAGNTFPQFSAEALWL